MPEGRHAPSRRQDPAATARVLRATRCRIGRSPLRRLCPAWLLAWLRRVVLDRVEVRLLRAGMGPHDVLEVLDALATQNAPGWLAGGWGVEALVGQVTRRHGDVDIAVPASGTDSAKVSAAAQALAQAGFSPVEAVEVDGDQLPDKVTLRDAEGRTVDLIPFLDRAEHGPTTGTIAGRPVPCVSLEAQFTLREGYGHRPVDRHDLRLLRHCKRTMRLQQAIDELSLGDGAMPELNRVPA